MSVSGTHAARDNWKRQIGAARIAWDKLSREELLKSAGQERKLSHMVQQRYTITRDEADRQVKSFIGFFGTVPE